jgi:zinc transport system permease protein
MAPVVENVKEGSRVGDLFGGPHGFLWLAVLVGLGASIAFGTLGTIIVAKRLAYLAGAVAHASIGGIGICLYLAQVKGWTWLDPLWGGALISIAAGIAMELVRRWAPDREDTLLSALWAVGMSVGLIFLAFTPGYANPTDFLFGNLLLVSPGDLWRVAFLDLVVLGVLVAFFPIWQAASFDEEFARLRGVRVEVFSILLIVLVSLSVVLLLAVVGLILVVALLTLPAATAGRFTRSLAGMMIGGTVLCVVCVLGGLGISYAGNWPTGPAIVLLAAALYLGASFWQRQRTHRGK